MIVGFVDRIRANRVEGWAWDSSDPDVPVVIMVTTMQGEPVIVERADQYRIDLKEAGIGDGACGFSIPLPLQSSATVDLKLVAVSSHASAAELPLKRIVASDSSVSLEMCPAYLYARTLKLWRELVGICPLVEVPPQSEDIEPLAGPVCSQMNRLIPPGQAFGPTFKSLDVVVLPPIDWDYRFARPQRLSLGLARLGVRVAYVSPHLRAARPNWPPYRLGTRQGVAQVSLRAKEGAQIQSGPLGADLASELAYGLSAFAVDQGISRPLFLVGSPGWAPLVDALPDWAAVYDVMDFAAGFSHAGDLLDSEDTRLIRRAAAVTVSAAPLMDYVMMQGASNVEMVRNAAFIDCFGLPAARGELTVSYIGALEDWFDTDLLEYSALKFPTAIFEVVGHIGPSHRRVRLPNVIYGGEQSPDEMVASMARSDVGIIPFLPRALTWATNPIKAYEYLAAGRPVVGTDLPELDHFTIGASRTTSRTEFIEALAIALVESRDPQLRRARSRSVATDTWEARSAQLLTLLTEVANQADDAISNQKGTKD